MKSTAYNVESTAYNAKAYNVRKSYHLRQLRHSIKLEPIAFVIKINMLPSVIEQVIAQGVDDDVVVDENTILVMHDTTSWKELDVHIHGNISKKIDLVQDFAESEKM